MNRHHWIDARLATVPLFRGLSKTQLRLVSGLATPLELKPGRVLTTEGGRGHEFIVIEDGEVEVRRGDRLIATRGPGEFVGEIALVEDRPRTATVVAKTPVVIAVIGRREFNGLLQKVPDVAEAVRVTAEQRLRELEAQVGSCDSGTSPPVTSSP
jgi:CRP/FNR family transcriptional regulator, cyclic AMP receptor protein